MHRVGGRGQRAHLARLDPPALASGQACWISSKVLIDRHYYRSTKESLCRHRIDEAGLTLRRLVAAGLGVAAFAAFKLCLPWMVQACASEAVGRYLSRVCGVGSSYRQLSEQRWHESTAAEHPRQLPSGCTRRTQRPPSSSIAFEIFFASEPFLPAPTTDEMQPRTTGRISRQGSGCKLPLQVRRRMSAVVVSQDSIQTFFFFLFLHCGLWQDY